MLSKADIATINRTRKILRDLESKYSVDFPDKEFAGGKFTEACKVAEDSLRNILVIAHAYLDEDVTDSEVMLTARD